MNETALIAEYRVRFDRAYYRGAMFALRPRIARFSHWFAVACFAVVTLMGLLFCGIAIADGEWGKACIGGVPLAGMLFYLNHRAPPDLALVRSAVEYRDEMELFVRATGLELVGAKSSITLLWPALRLARMQSTGILLIDRDGAGVWLPESGRRAGSREDVEAVLAGTFPNGVEAN